MYTGPGHTLPYRSKKRYNPQQLTNKFLREVEHVWMHQRIISCIDEHNWHTDVVQVVGRAVIAVQLLYTSEPKDSSVRRFIKVSEMMSCEVTL